MKKLFLFILITGFVEHATAQKIIINGNTGNRLLTWDDFYGKPDKSSEHQANTHWKINFSFDGIEQSGDLVKPTGLSITLEFDGSRSWVKPGTATDHLLKHEQGHFDAGLLCQQEMIAQLGKSVFPRQRIGPGMQDLFNSILNKYVQLNKQYDGETNHSKIKEKQAIWNNFFDTELKR